MPCFHPLMGFRFVKKDGTRSRPFFGGNVQELKQLGSVEPVQVPCGRCIGCRLEKSRMWAMRCVHEAKQYEHNSFITLTYDKEHCPPDYSLKKRDFQLFMKRLRKAYSDKKIRFFACGEYGEKTFRPHYHAILFNHQFDDEEEQIRMTESGPKKVLVSPKLTQLWGQGITSTGEMTFNSAAYVARYCLKKINGPDADSYYFGREPEFSLMSRMPGIGANYFIRNKQDIYSNDFCVIRGKKCAPPPYYDRLLEKVDKVLYDYVKGKRIDGFDLLDIGRGDNSLARLYDREQVQKIKQNKISRKI